MSKQSKSGDKLQRGDILSRLSEKAKSFTDYFENAEPIIESVTKYSEIVGEIPMLSILKVFSKILEDVTKIDDPEELGYHASKIAFLDALQIELNSENFNSPVEPKRVVKEVEEQLREIGLNDVDFTIFKLNEATTHEFFKLAEKQTDARLTILGFEESKRNELILKIRDKIEDSLKKLFTKKDTAEKFARFKDYIELDPTNKIARKNLARHSKYQIWQYTSAPVLGREPFALKDVFVEPECGLLRWKDIHPDEEMPNRKIEEARRERQNPFDEKCGGRHKMIDLVMKLIADKNEKDPIIIQGLAGSGKTSFTLRLCEKLIENGLSPIRVRLRDITLSKNIEEALAQATRLSNEEYVDRSPFINNEILKEKGVGEFSDVSRYILIFDGWDELSVSASQSFKTKVDEMLNQLINIYLEYKKNLRIKVILTGRPSADVTDSTFLKENTPILTVRDSSPKQFEEFVNKITNAVKSKQIDAFKEKLINSPQEYLSDIVKADEMPLDIEDWSKLTKDKFKEVLQTFRSTPKEIEVLGLPLLAHLASRLIAVWKDDAIDLIRDKTLLYRNLINMTCEKAGKANIDERDKKTDIKDQPRFIGEKLRKLLWGTASAMSVFNEDSISHDELQLRLESEDELKEIVAEINEKNWLSSLLISFYFKGGAKDLGCEFSHKSFREYLFAEAIVEALKDYGREAKENLPEREKYWEDFQENDLRYNFSRRLAKLFAPQELKAEVYFYLENLLSWEINRSANKTKVKEVGLQTQSLDLEEWQKIRDGLTDVWSWWVDKVHLRPQMITTKRQNVEYAPSFIHDLIEFTIPFVDGKKVPSDSASLDTKLGRTLFSLVALVYESIRDLTKKENNSIKKYQRQENDKIYFVPAAPGITEELAYRISSLGFLSSNYMNLDSIDLRSGFLYLLHLSRVSIQNTKFSQPMIYHFTLTNSNFSYGDFSGATIIQSRLAGTGNHSTFAATILNFVDFSGSTLVNVDFSGSTLRFTELTVTDLANANFTNAKLTLCNFSNANCESTIFNETTFHCCLFKNTTFCNADLSKTIGLTKEQLEEAFINEGTKLPENLEQYKEHFIRLTKERMKPKDDVVEVEIDDLEP